MGRGIAAGGGQAESGKRRMVRDSVIMPENEYGLIAGIKQRCLARGMAVKKSEVLRAALINLSALSYARLANAMQALEVIKTGRPSKDKSKGV